jgi:16S rRNA (cytosine1402-N4)-methyltransferase
VSEGETFRHVPVLAAEVVAWLQPPLAGGTKPAPAVPERDPAAPGSGTGVPPRALLVDCTVGGGGHAEALLGAAPDAALLGLDRDPAALQAAGRRLASFGDRVTLMPRPFDELASALAESGAASAQAVLYDLGVSSAHLDQPGRGFGYRAEGPLDMRMDPGIPRRAADVVNDYPEGELAAVLARWGEERFARRIAAAIVRRRAVRRFATTTDLADVVREAIPAATRRTGGHPARRTFQALRIEVNDELGQLLRSLPQAIDALSPGGRVAVISYHSLEDRIAKRTFAGAAAGCRCPADLPVCACGARALLRILTRKPVRPTAAELAENPRAASARLRVAERLGEPEAA